MSDESNMITKMMSDKIDTLFDKTQETNKDIINIDRRVSALEYKTIDDVKCEKNRNKLQDKITEQCNRLKRLEDATKLTREVSGGVITVWKKFIPVLALVILTAIAWLFFQWAQVIIEKTTGVKIQEIQKSERRN